MNTIGRYGVTPLQEAAYGSDVEVVKALVDAGANLQARDSEGRTVLMAALDNPDTGVLAWLLTQHVNVNLKDKKGETALSIANEKRTETIADNEKPVTENKLIVLLHAHGARW